MLTDKQIEALAKIAVMNAAVLGHACVLAGMKAENMSRESSGCSIAYGEDHFIAQGENIMEAIKAFTDGMTRDGFLP